MDTKNTVSLSLGQELDLTLGIEVGLGTRVCREGELANLVLDTRSLELLLGLADPSNLRVGVHNRGNSLVVDVAVTLADVLNSGTSLLFGLVCEHRSESDVTDTLDVLDGRIELIVDDDATLVVEFHTSGFEVETVGKWPPADGDQDDVRLELYRMLSANCRER